MLSVSVLVADCSAAWVALGLWWGQLWEPDSKQSGVIKQQHQRAFDRVWTNFLKGLHRRGNGAQCGTTRPRWQNRWRY